MQLSQDEVGGKRTVALCSEALQNGVCPRRGTHHEGQKDIPIDQRMQEAVGELRGVIGERYPSAAFAASHGEDPERISLDATFDI